MERYLSLSLGNLRFIDSLQFLNASLEELVENLASDGLKPFLLLQKEYQDPAQTHLMKRKGVYPYNYVKFFSKYEEKKLQPKIPFYNTLTKTHITNDEYMHAQQVWSTFNLKNLGEYHDIYLKSDVLLLADVFENFRDLTMKTYHLDPAHFFSCPQLSWQSALKFTKCKLKLLSDPTQYLFFEEGIRGGVSAITKRYAKANNKDLQEDYNPQLPSNYLLYLDCRVALSDYLPTGDFKWLTEEEISILNVSNLPEDNEKGYIIECDLEYSTDLHASHTDYPLAPERMIVNDEMLSAHSNKMWRDIQDHYTSEIKRAKTSKLIPNLCNKKNYVIHYRNLKQCIFLGLKLTKIHRVLEFSQAAFLKPYIDLNTAKRAQSKNDWEKNFYKLMNNAVFGKTLENLRNRVDVKLAHTEKKL